MKVSIYRYNPDTDDVPYLQDYDFETPEGRRDLMVLDMLELLKEQDPSLAFRRSCREGVCGSDGMNINGVNALACITRVSDVLNGGELRSGQRFPRSRSIVIRPLPGMPVIRDLVVDMDLFMAQYKSIKPWLINDNPPPARERLQTPEERERLDGLYECILCGCCTSACPSWWWNPETYVGPAGLLWSYRFLADSRDQGADERLSELDDPYSVFRCRAVLNCVAFCPKGLNPRNAISRIEGMLLEKGT
ncbi:MAG: succinate dehydrogenase iron-sulfur subunit [Pseudomonadales bacterium]